MWKPQISLMSISKGRIETMATAPIKQSTAPRDGDRPRATLDPAPAANTGSHHGEGRLQGLIAKRLACRDRSCAGRRNQTLMIERLSLL
jgi:hypothetical protein